MKQQEYVKHPVYRVVAPLKAEAIEYAEKNMRTHIEHLKAKLEDAGWDLNKAAPHPDSMRMSRYAYQAAKVLRQELTRITKRDERVPHSYMPNAPYIVVISPEGVEHEVNAAKRIAAQQYDAFVLKLIHKVGPCKNAKIEGNHIWGHSFLTVKFADKPDEVWKTQQITNRSKLGTWFHQWPSRIVKHKR